VAAVQLKLLLLLLQALELQCSRELQAAAVVAACVACQPRWLRQQLAEHWMPATLLLLLPAVPLQSELADALLRQTLLLLLLHPVHLRLPTQQLLLKQVLMLLEPALLLLASRPAAAAAAGAA
jgi:hypothetical protein